MPEPRVLYVCHKHPSVVPLISPSRWEAAKAGRWQTAAEPWSVSELAAALRALASADNMPLKMCFFIDGLDEYDSDHVELCKVLCDMANSPHIKMCLSSRPWAVFERSFGGESKESKGSESGSRAHEVLRWPAL